MARLPSGKHAGMSFRRLLAGSNKNLEALAAANRVVIDGYADMLRCQCEMLRGLFDDIRTRGAGADELSARFKGSLAAVRDDVSTLQKMAKKTHSRAGHILKRRAQVNLEAMRSVLEEAGSRIR